MVVYGRSRYALLLRGLHLRGRRKQLQLRDRLRGRSVMRWARRRLRVTRGLLLGQVQSEGNLPVSRRPMKLRKEAQEISDEYHDTDDQVEVVRGRNCWVLNLDKE